MLSFWYQPITNMYPFQSASLGFLLSSSSIQRFLLIQMMALACTVTLTITYRTLFYLVSKCVTSFTDLRWQHVKLPIIKKALHRNRSDMTPHHMICKIYRSRKIVLNQPSNELIVCRYCDVSSTLSLNNVKWLIVQTQLISLSFSR